LAISPLEATPKATSTSFPLMAMATSGTVLCGPTLVKYKAHKAHREHPAHKVFREVQALPGLLDLQELLGLLGHKALKDLPDHRVLKATQAPLDL
jgi:hypothetical protein